MDLVSKVIIEAVISGIPQKKSGEDVEVYKALRELIRHKYGRDLLIAIERLESKPNLKSRQYAIPEEMELSGADKDPELQQSAQTLANLLPEKFDQNFSEIQADSQHSTIENKAEVNGSGAAVQGNDNIVTGEKGIAVKGNVHGGIQVIINERAKTIENFDLEDEIKSYCERSLNIHEKLPLMGFKTSLRVPIKVEDIYVPLRAMIDMRATGNYCFADSEDAEKCLREHGADREISVPDAFRITEEMGRRGVVILGDPGSGKTTHLKRLLLWCFHGGPGEVGLPKDMLPVFLPLRELENVDQGLSAFIQKQLDHPHLDTPKGFGKKLLKQGNLLFLLDGLDEVSDPKHRRKVSRWIDEAVKFFPTCRFIVTCRFAGYTDDARLSEEFLEMHIRPLSGKEAGQFIYNWYRIVETGLSTDKKHALTLAKERTLQLINRLKMPDFRSRRVFWMTRNPLLLTNLCLVHRDRGRLPDKRVRLYEECTDVLLEIWREAIGFKSKITADIGRRILQPAAFWMHQEEGRTRATAEELAPVIEPVIKAVGWEHGSAQSFLKIVRDESGILTGWSQEYYGFMHLGFQEYLTAREIQNQSLEKPEILKELAFRFGESWWQEVTLLMLALESPALFRPFMREVVKQPAFARRSDLMEMCLADSIEVSAGPFLDLLEKNPGKDQELWERQLAALRMVERIDESVLEKVIEGLKNHPFEKIQKWIKDRYAEENQDVIHPDPSGYELVLIKGGTFMMGSPEDEEGRFDWEGPQHQVTVSDFYMGRYPVTNEEYNRFLEANSKATEPKYWSDRKFNQPKQPVVGVSWHDAQAYAKWAGLRLPTEAEWEYACRAGTTTRFSWGDEADCSRANYGNSSYSSECKDKNPGQTSPVGDYPSNAWGLYDMHGNIWEWCRDHCEWKDGIVTDTYVDGVINPLCTSGSFRVIRGGAWSNVAGYCRSASRGINSPDARHNFLGFRLSRASILDF